MLLILRVYVAISACALISLLSDNSRDSNISIVFEYMYVHLYSKGFVYFISSLTWMPHMNHSHGSLTWTTHMECSHGKPSHGSGITASAVKQLLEDRQCKRHREQSNA